MKRKAIAKVHESKCVTPDTLGLHVLVPLRSVSNSRQPWGGARPPSIYTPELRTRGLTAQVTPLVRPGARSVMMAYLLGTSFVPALGWQGPGGGCCLAVDNRASFKWNSPEQPSVSYSSSAWSSEQGGMRVVVVGPCEGGDRRDFVKEVTLLPQGLFHQSSLISICSSPNGIF